MLKGIGIFEYTFYSQRLHLKVIFCSACISSFRGIYECSTVQGRVAYLVSEDPFLIPESGTVSVMHEQHVQNLPFRKHVSTT